MMRKILITLISITALSLPANAFDWSFINPIYRLNSANNTTTTPVAQTQSTLQALNTLNNLREQSQNIDKNVQNTFISIISKLYTPQQTNTLQTRFDSIFANTSSSETEKTELLNQLFNIYTSDITSNKNNFILAMQKLSEDDKAGLSQDINSLYQYGQQYLKLGKEGISATSAMLKASSKASDTINSIIEIKKAAEDYNRKAKTILNVTNKISSIARIAGIK